MFLQSSSPALAYLRFYLDVMVGLCQSRNATLSPKDQRERASLAMLPVEPGHKGLLGSNKCLPKHLKL